MLKKKKERKQMRTNILLTKVQEKAKIENNNEEIFKERNNG